MVRENNRLTALVTFRGTSHFPINRVMVRFVRILFCQLDPGFVALPKLLSYILMSGQSGPHQKLVCSLT